MDDAPMDSLFFGAGRQSILEQLQHLSRFSSDITVLIGPQGSGKSIVGDFFVKQSESDQLVARISGNMLTTPAVLLTDILNVFAINYSQDAMLDEMRDIFVDFVRDARDRSRSVVLLVDDAHELGDDAFGMLTRMALAPSESGNFHLMFLGESPLVDMLECTCPLKKGRNQFTVSQLEAMSVEDTEQYLRFRLTSEGFGYEDAESRLPFSRRQIERIHKQSAGVPGVMHGLAAFEFQAPTKSLGDGLIGMFASFPRHYAYGGLALIVVLLGVTVLMGGGEPQSQEQRSVSLPMPAAAQQGQQTTQEQAGVPYTVISATATVEPSPFIPTPALSSVTAQAQTADATVASAVESQAEPVRPVEVPAPVVTPTRSPTPTAAPEIATIQSLDSATSASASISAAPVRAAAPERPVASTASIASSSVMSLPPEQFTIQLLGASSKANIEDFLRRNAGNPLYMFESTNSGRPWFVVIHGTYESRVAASSAVARLGPKLAVDQPWIRRISDVQSSVVP
jgi:DamX protein